MNSLRKGFTTGTAASAATKAAIYQMAGETVTKVSVTLPNGSQMIIPIHATGSIEPGVFYAEVKKDGGDDPDVTNGIIIRATVKGSNQLNRIIGGIGVGKVTKPGLPVKPGEAAINPIPLRMINQAIAEAPISNGLEVIIEVPQGEQLAHKTLNPRLGIVGGISILGTTGIVEPMSEESWKESLASQLKIIRAAGYETLVLTPGRQGFRRAVEYGIPEGQIAEMSNFVGFMLEEATWLGFKNVLLWGYFGKMVKVAGGSFNTHSKVSDARLEILTAITAVYERDFNLLSKIFHANTTEEAVEYLTQQGKDQLILNKVAERASRKALEKVPELSFGCILLDRSGRIRGMDQGARQIIEAEQWQFNG